MYDVLLTRRYLTSRVIPLIAVAAVALCVALVIIVVSVMTGFLDMVKDSGRTLMGDVVVRRGVVGLPYYERLMERIEALPEAEAAAPIVDGFGLLKMPYPVGERKQTEYVQVWGVDAERLGRVTGFAETLYWKRPPPDLPETDFRNFLLKDLGPVGLDRLYDAGRTLTTPPGAPPAIVLGMHVSIGNERERDGSYSPVMGPLGYWFMPKFELTLTMMPIGSQGGMLDPDPLRVQVVNEFLSGVFMIDQRRVMIPIDAAQNRFRLDAAEIYDDDGNPTGRMDPARATMILVRAADGVTPEQLRDAIAGVHEDDRPEIEGAYERFRADLAADADVPDDLIPPMSGQAVQILTWRQQQREFIDPIEKERELMRVLFSIIYLVCAGLVLAIFWAIVYEKTRDIGILRSVGAARFGIGMIFLRYGAIIGVIGSILGLGLAWVIVHNINEIHDAVGHPAPTWSWILMYALAAVALVGAVWPRERLLPVVLWSVGAIAAGGLGAGLMLHRGLLVWDPSVYYFTEIPNTIDPVTATTTMIGAVIFSVLGAFIPAMKAADVDPVQALRYE